MSGYSGPGGSTRPDHAQSVTVRMVILAAVFLVLWAAATILLTRFKWFRPRESLVERLAPYVQSPESSWTDDVERWLGGFGEPSRTKRRDEVPPLLGRCRPPVTWDHLEPT